MAEALLHAAGLTRRFGGTRGLLGRARPPLHALQEVSLTVEPGETLGIVGESGCGKSTLARLMVGLDAPSDGQITVAGRDPSGPGLGRQVQYVFQDPVSALNPRHKVRSAIEAPLRHLLNLDSATRAARLHELMDAVNLPTGLLDRYPHELSGGQAQRIGIARALAADPALIVLDEPVSALDVSVQAQVLALLADLKDRFGLTYVFISHDLAVVEAIADRVAVMYFGRIAEIGPAPTVFGAPKHPYTRLLLQSAPVPGRRLGAFETGVSDLPDPYDPPKGCAFAARCPRASDGCRFAPPVLEPADAPHQAACLHPDPGG